LVEAVVVLTYKVAMAMRRPCLALLQGFVPCSLHLCRMQSSVTSLFHSHTLFVSAAYYAMALMGLVYCNIVHWTRALALMGHKPVLDSAGPITGGMTPLPSSSATAPQAGVEGGSSKRDHLNKPHVA
jgi:hypothetical protein